MLLALVLAACGSSLDGPGATREGNQPVRGPTLSIGGGVGGFVGHVR